MKEFWDGMDTGLKALLLVIVSLFVVVVIGGSLM